LKFIFYYDETEHSRVINQNTISANNYYDNFITVIVGWNVENESKIEQRYKVFEDKYENRKSKGELKSTTLSQKHFQYGFASMSKYNLQFISDFLDVFDDDIYLFFSVQSKLEYVICQLLNGYRNSMFVDMDLLKYSLIKAIHTYMPTNVIDSIYNHPDDLLKQIRIFLEERIKINKSNLQLKSGENEAFERVINVLDDIQEFATINWDYHMPFNGFRLFLCEQGIEDYQLVIDREGDKHSTLRAAWDLGHIEADESDSKESFGIRMADFTAGIIAKFMKSLCDALLPDCSDLRKVILDSRWFDLNDLQHGLYEKLHHVLSGINDCWYKSYAGVFADDLIVFIALLEYIDSKPVDELKNPLNMQGEYFNSYSLQCLKRHFELIHNKLPVEPITLIDGEYFINKWGAKVYADARKQPGLIVEEGHRECYVMNAGFDMKGIPTITIKENGKYECYRIPSELSEWVQTLVGYVTLGETILPSKVIFTKKDGKWYADLL